MATVDLYSLVLRRAGVENDDNVLAVCAGTYDKTTLIEAGIRRAIISNVNFHDGVSEYAPYEWSFQDAENITLPDESVDWAVVHAGLHHCASPHRAMCEMLRVARKGIVVIESRDNLLMRAAVRFGLAAEYELEPVALSEGQFGGYRNTHVPNFVYRWTEREVEKTVKSFQPQRKPEISYFYQYKVPLERLSMSNNSTKRLIARAAATVTQVFQTVLPRQGNLFGFVVHKKTELQPWFSEVNNDGYVLNKDYFRKLYTPENFKKS